MPLWRHKRLRHGVQAHPVIVVTKKDRTIKKTRNASKDTTSLITLIWPMLLVASMRKEKLRTSAAV
jgi:hypothetical protein